VGICWKPIIIEVLLEILLELAPNSLDTLATFSEYLVESGWEAAKALVQLVLIKTNYQKKWELPYYLPQPIASPTIS
jgi:hypothetical protein